MESDLLRIRFAGIVGQTPVAHKISRGMTARALDQTLWRTAHLLQGHGVHVVGALVEEDKEDTPEPPQEHAIEKMNLRIFPTGKIFNIFVPEKCEKAGCRLDANPFQKVIDTVHDLLIKAPEHTVLVLNRFGKEEAKGHGYSKIFELAAQNDIPLIIGVSNNVNRKGESPLRKAWNTYIEGTTGISLPGDAAVITKWCQDHHILTI